MKRMSAAAGAALLAMTGTPASAAWLRASSQHFVVIENTSEARLRAEATELERYDALLRRFHKVEVKDDDAFNKVTIYVVGGVDALQKLAHNRSIGGWYVPRVDGSVAFMPRVSGASADDGDMTAQIVLYHEYAHHFLLGNVTVAYPMWFSEGYAEFASTASHRKDGYWLGVAANHRGYGLVAGPPMPAAMLFDPPAKLTDAQMDALYGHGWLLTHYIMFDTERRKQFNRFLTLFNGGKPALTAATEAFGDLKELDRALDKYLHKSQIPALRVGPEVLGSPPVEVRALSAGEAAMIDYRIRSTAGVDGKTAGPLFAKARPVAALYPDDAVAQGWLAEMAFDAGDLDAAGKAADAAIKADPRSSQGLLYKSRVMMARLVTAKSTDGKAWDAARRPIIEANRAQSNDAAALRLFYDSFGFQGVAPRASAKQGLYRAAELIPQDQGTRFAAACQELLDGDDAMARALLRPLAADPHAGRDNAAVKMLAALDAGKHGQAVIAAGNPSTDDAANGAAAAH